MSRNFILPEGWEYKNLLELVDVIGGVGYTPKDITGEGIRVIRGGNIQDSIVVLREDDVFLPVNYKNESNTLYKGDIVLVASTGSVEALGRTATVWEDMPNVQIGAFLRILRPKSIKIAPLVSAWLCSEHYFKYIRRIAKGTSINNIGKEHLRNFKIPVPTEEILSSVSQFYININRKISLNRTINAELEQMAKEIYDYWFVQFDFPDENGRPYKSSGGAMEYNPILKREIPKGWEVKNLFNTVDLLYGFPFSTELFTEEKNNKPVIRIRDIQDGSISAYTTESVDDKYLLNEGDLIIGMDGNFHMNYWYDNKTYLNQRCLRIRQLENSNLSTIQIFHSIRPYIKAKEKYAKGSTVGHLLDSDLRGIIIIEPQGAFTLSIKNTLDNILNTIIKNIKETHSLTSLRDFLLPLLMNGQVTIKD